MMSTTDLKLDFLLSRRSASALGAPAPTRDQLDRILLAAGAVPDHGLLRPFRFVIVEGDGRLELGRGLAEAAAEHRPGIPEAKLEGIRAKALRSPTIIVLVASPKPGKVETWEQHATAACAGYAITLAAHALDVGAVWKSVPFTKGRALTEILGLAETEEMLGWIHLGTALKDEAAPPHAPLDLSELATVIDGSGRRPYR
jgi:nitroreductase